MSSVLAVRAWCLWVRPVECRTGLWALAERLTDPVALAFPAARRRQEARRQEERMRQVAAAWSDHSAVEPGRQR